MNASPVDSLRETGGNAKVRRTAAESACSRLHFHAPAGLLRSLHSFLCARGGGGAIESAIAIAVLVTVFAGLMAIAHAAYEDDRMGRAARAAARAVALVTDTTASQPTLDAVACTAIKNELALVDGFDCKTWDVTVKAGLTASALSTGLTASALSSGANTAGNSGDMILVTIDGWERAPWVTEVRKLDDPEGRVATGVARREPTDT